MDLSLMDYVDRQVTSCIREPSLAVMPTLRVSYELVRWIKL